MIEVMGKPRDTSPVILASAPRAMKQPRKHVLRDALRDAADAKAELTRERDAWRELAEREPQDSMTFPALTLLAIGWAIGAVCGALAGWAL